MGYRRGYGVSVESDTAEHTHTCIVYQPSMSVTASLDKTK